MRQRADDPALSIQRNVSDAFDGFMRRVGKIAEQKVGKAVLAALKTDGFPAEFVDQINWCRKRTILDPALAESLHRLRVWRNAATRTTTNGGRVRVRAAPMRCRGSSPR